MRKHRLFACWRISSRNPSSPQAEKWETHWRAGLFTETKNHLWTPPLKNIKTKGSNSVAIAPCSQRFAASGWWQNHDTCPNKLQGQKSKDRHQGWKTRAIEIAETDSRIRFADRALSRMTWFSSWQVSRHLRGSELAWIPGPQLDPSDEPASGICLANWFEQMYT